MEEAQKETTSLFSKLKSYFVHYFKTLNYPFYVSRILLSIGLFLVDYFTKHAAYNALHGKGEGYIVENFIPGLIDLTLVGNQGAAWGAFSGKRWALVIISAIASIGLTVNLLFRFTAYNRILMIGITLMLPGASGNLVDRIGYRMGASIYKDGVVDFLQFHFWKSFPICNIADYCLTIGVVFLVIGFVLEFIKEYKQRKREEAADKGKPEQEKDSSPIRGQEDRNKKLNELSKKELTDHDPKAGSQGKE